MLSSKEGLALLKLLNQDGGDTLRQAAAAFQQGDRETAQALLTPIMETEQAKMLLRALNQNG